MSSANGSGIKAKPMTCYGQNNLDVCIKETVAPGERVWFKESRYFHKYCNLFFKNENSSQ